MLKRAMQKESDVGCEKGMFATVYRGGLSIACALVGGRTRVGEYSPGQIINVAQDQKGDILVPLPEEEGIPFGILLHNNLQIAVGVPLFVEGCNLFDDGPPDPSGAGSILELGPNETAFVTHRVGAGGKFGVQLLTAQKGQGATWAETHTNQNDQDAYSGIIDVWRRLAEVPLYSTTYRRPPQPQTTSWRGNPMIESRDDSAVGVGAGEVEALNVTVGTSQFERQAAQIFRCRVVTRDEVQSTLGLGDGVLWESPYSQQWWTQAAAIVPQQMIGRPKVTTAKRPVAPTPPPQEDLPKIPGLVCRHPTNE